MPATLIVGIATAVSGTTVTVLMPDGTTLPVQRYRHVACNVNDAVVITREGGAQWVSAALGAAPAPPPEPPADDDDDTTPTPPPPAEVRTGTTVVQPTYTGTHRVSWRGDTGDLYQGDYSGRGLNFGAAFYSSKIQNLPGSLTDAWVQLNRGIGGVFGAQRPTVCLLAGKSRPGGRPTVLASTLGPSLAVVGHGTSKSKWRIPSAWRPLLDSGEAGGFGIWITSNSPYIHLLTSGAGMSFVGEWKETS